MRSKTNLSQCFCIHIIDMSEWRYYSRTRLRVFVEDSVHQLISLSFEVLSNLLNFHGIDPQSLFSQNRRLLRSRIQTSTVTMEKVLDIFCQLRECGSRHSNLEADSPRLPREIENIRVAGIPRLCHISVEYEGADSSFDVA